MLSGFNTYAAGPYSIVMPMEWGSMGVPSIKTAYQKDIACLRRSKSKSYELSRMNTFFGLPPFFFCGSGSGVFSFLPLAVLALARLGTGPSFLSFAFVVFSDIISPFSIGFRVEPG